MNPESGNSVVIRAALKNYYVVGVWILLAILFYLLSSRTTPLDPTIRMPKIRFEVLALFFAVLAISWLFWVRSLKITVSDKSFEYRNGFYKFKTPLKSIENVKDEYIPISLVIQQGRLPKFFVTLKNGNGLAFKTKPFRRDDLVKMFLALKKAGAWKRQDTRVNSIFGHRAF
jgi:hypothetical protein